MTGVAFRQLRAAIIGTTAVVGVLILALLAHAGRARAVGSELTLTCRTSDGAGCRALRTELWDMHLAIAPYLGYLTMTTVLIAVFWGAPLVSREVESGTAALAWSQSVTRRRWLLGRLAVSTAVVGALGLALGFAVTWWLASFDAAPEAGEDALNATDLHGPLLPALWITGLLIGVLVGTVVPRTLPAMVITAAVTFLIAIAVNLTGRPPVVDDELHVLTGQALKAVMVLAVGVLAALVAFWRITRLRI